MDRNQFTFYKSFRDALKRIRKKADRADAYDAICDYALYGIEPDVENMPDAAAIVFELVRPSLDASKRKAENGKTGGASKQSASKPEANRKQEREQERERDKEQMLNPPPPLRGVGPDLQSAFADWLTYKAERRETYKPTGLKNLETEVLNNAKKYGEAAVADLIHKCMASNWQGIIFDRLEKPGGREKSPVGSAGTGPLSSMEQEAVRRMLEGKA